MNRATRHRFLIYSFGIFGIIGCFDLLSSSLADKLVLNFNAPLIVLAAGLWLCPRFTRWIAMTYLAFLFFFVVIIVLFFGPSAGFVEFTKLLLIGALLGFLWSEIKDWYTKEGEPESAKQELRGNNK